MNIAPYTPLAVWLSTASRYACPAAAAGSAGWVQPCTSARIWAPIHSRKGLRCRAVSGGSTPSSRLRYATRSAVKTRPAGSVPSQSRATSSVVKPGPWRRSSSSPSRGKFRSSSSGMPSMFSASEVAAERRFQGWAAASSAGSPRAVNHVVSGQLPVARARARMPARGSFSTGLPSRQPAARPSQAACSRSGPSATGRARGAGHRGHAARIAGRSVGSSAASGLSMRASSSSRRPASARSRGGAGTSEAPARAGAGAPPAAYQRRSASAVSRPSCAACRSSWPTRSSG